MTRKQYPEYKPSGVEWLGDIPEHWELKPLKRLFMILNGSTPKSAEPSYWDGEILWATPDDLGQLEGATITQTRRMITEEGYSSCGTTIAPKGSLVLSTRAPIGHLAIAGDNICTNQGCRSLVFRANDDKRYFYFLVFASRPELESWGQGSTFKELSRDKLSAIKLVCPPPELQRAIATFLDRETAKIDTLIAKKERQIELLKEKRTALISHVVTKGLDPNVKMKDSGIEWLGEIPEHWKILKLKFLVRFVSGGTPLTSNPEYWNGDVPWVSPKDMKDMYLHDTQDYITQLAVKQSATSILPKDTALVVVRSGILRHTIPVSLTKRTVAFNQDIKGIIPQKLNSNKKLSPEYFVWFVEGNQKSLLPLWKKEGTTVESIEFEYLSNSLFPLPPYTEQKNIILYVNRSCQYIDMQILKIKDSIALLNEYRAALISAAVTGKIDVRQELSDEPYSN